MANPNLTVMSITALAIAIAEGKDEDDIELLASIFSQLGDTLATIALQKDAAKPK